MKSQQGKCTNHGQVCIPSVENGEGKGAGSKYPSGVPSPYSPDLNPIEFLWKSVKRIVSRTLIASEMRLKALIERTFEEISMFNSYSMGG